MYPNPKIGEIEVVGFLIPLLFEKTLMSSRKIPFYFLIEIRYKIIIMSFLFYYLFLFLKNRGE